MNLMGTVHTDQRGNIRVLAMDNPPVNAIGSGVRVGLYEAIKFAQDDSVTQAIVITGSDKGFAAGADVREFGGDPTKPVSMADIRELIQAGDLPVVAAITGVALGGGLELAMYCDCRVADKRASLGLPELNLGLIPGGGGTQHLTRLVGAEQALDIIMSGKVLLAERAHELGIVDELCDGDAVDVACRAAQALVSANRRVDIRSLNAKLVLDQQRPGIFEQARALAAKRKSGQFAPLKAIEAVEAAVAGDYQAGIDKERECVQACLANPQRAAMGHLFFAERQAGKVPGIARDTSTAPVNTVAVIGIGAMGSGIAVNCLARGCSVLALGRDDPGGGRAVARIREILERDVKSGRLSAENRDAQLSRLTGASSIEELSEADLVIEAIYESLQDKRALFAALGPVMKQAAILSTNTSGLDLDALAQASGRPGKVLGLHFFNPANIMRLLEVVRGAATSPETLATGLAVARLLGKIPVVSGNAPGFIGNRMVQAYNNQARELLLSGAYPQQVDKAATDFGLAMGPFQLQDLVGLGLLVKMHEGVENLPDRVKPHFAVHAQGRRGRANGRGFYRYTEGKRGPQHDPEVDEIISGVREELGYASRLVGTEEIHQRLFYALINAGAHLLGEGVALRPSDLDVVYHFGYAFPVYRGGPMFYADTVGVKNVYDKVLRFHQEYGELWTPAPLLKELADADSSFAQWQQQAGNWQQSKNAT